MAAFQLHYPNGDTVDVEHQVWATVKVAVQGGFLGDGAIVVLRLIPVNEMDRLRDLARFALHRNAVAQQFVHFLVVVIKAAVGIVRLDAEFVDCTADLCRGVIVFGKVRGEKVFFDVAVVRAVGPIVEVAIAELVPEQRDDAALGDAFWLADGCHAFPFASKTGIARSMN